MRPAHLVSALSLACFAPTLARAVPAPDAPMSARNQPLEASTAGEVATPVPSPHFVEPESEARGFVLDFSAGLVVPSGSYVSGLDAASFGVGVAHSLTVGAYTTPHFGVVGGLRFSYKHQGFSDCDANNDCSGFTYQFPVLAQYAFRNRKEGPYLQGGLAFASTYSITSQVGGLTFSSPFDYKLGVGYRISQAAFIEGPNRPSRNSLDIYANLDFGQFSHIKSTVIGAKFDGDVGADQQTHYMVEVGVAIHWTP